MVATRTHSPFPSPFQTKPNVKRSFVWKRASRRKKLDKLEFFLPFPFLFPPSPLSPYPSFLLSNFASAIRGQTLARFEVGKNLGIFIFRNLSRDEWSTFARLRVRVFYFAFFPRRDDLLLIDYPTPGKGWKGRGVVMIFPSTGWQKKINASPRFLEQKKREIFSGNFISFLRFEVLHSMWKHLFIDPLKIEMKFATKNLKNFP